MAALGIPGWGGFPFADVPTGSLPYRNNVETPAGLVTAGAWRFEQAGHGMLGTIEASSSYEPPIVPPFVSRDSMAG